AGCRHPAPPRAARGPCRPARPGPGNRRGCRSFATRRGTPGMDRCPGLAALALGVLVGAAPAAAQVWNSDAALALARRAVLRRGEGDEVRDVPHPLSAAGPDIYDFALGDTTTIMLPEREVRVVTLRVRPKDFGLPRIVGTLYLDVETADLVRMAFNFTPRSYLDAELEDVSIVLDNALWERRYWLPYRQEIEIRRRATWLDVAVRGIIRARWEIDGYVLNLGLANSWFAGD